jgi:branched-chain amino acid transport system substrate-binding protein
MKKGILAMTVVMVALIIMVGFLDAAPKEMGKPIILGSPQALGFDAGHASTRGVTLAVDEINAAGGVNVAGERRPFKLITVDARDTEPGVSVSDVLLLIEKLITQSGANFIVLGPSRSEGTLAMMDLLAKYKVINVNGLSMSPALGAKVAKDYEKYKYFFSVTSWADWLVADQLGPCVRDLGKKFGINKVFIIVQDVAHARAGGEGMEKFLKAQGWEVVGHETYPTGSSDFSSGLLKARAAGRSILFLWGDMAEFNILIRQWYDMKVPALPIGMVVFFGDPGLWKATGGKCGYSMSETAVAGNVASKATPWTMKYHEAYKKRWGKEPEFHGPTEGYMAVYVIKDAIERAGTLDADSVVKAMEQTDMMGVYGRMRFDPKSHRLIFSLNPKEGAVGNVFQWQDGKRVSIFPPAIATGEAKLPPWMK